MDYACPKSGKSGKSNAYKVTGLLSRDLPNPFLCGVQEREQSRPDGQDVTKLRGQARDASDTADRDAAEQALAGGLGKLMLLAEAYPDLKAGENFRQLTTQLTEVEDHIAKARRFYNGAVRQLNDRVQHVPDRFIAGPFGFREEAFFSAGIETRQAPDVGKALNGDDA